MQIELKVRFEANTENGAFLDLYVLPVKDEDTGEYRWIHLKENPTGRTLFEVTVQELANLMSGIEIAVSALTKSENCCVQTEKGK